ncbi:unnamed protein product [Brachionus calyciflorus]|uniref:OTU domain-containing protein n=1 Tax=Brachionus calyciflorus TaxID=104777 RepID=A0A814D447_9BILA|nr:unnamed protein product [Brachionus calyciflorus]
MSVFEVENYLMNIFNIFNNPRFDSTVVYSLQTLQTKISERNLTNTDISGDFYGETKINENLSSQYLQKIEAKSFDQEKNLKLCSPFGSYFNDLIKSFESKIIKHGKVFSNENEYYCPDLFDIIQDRLYLLPLWSGLMIRDVTFPYEVKTRLSNNPVENYFGYLKNQLSLNKKSTSELVAVLYKRLSVKYCEYYNSDYKYESDLFETLPKETWKKKNDRRKKKKNSIEQESNNFQSLKEKFFEHKILFENYLDFLRSIQPLNEFEGQEVYFSFKKNLNLDEHFYPVNSKPDGNCLYNSFAILLYGNETDFFSIKACSIFIMLTNEYFFNEVLHEYSYDFSFEDLIVSTCKRNEWGNELNILSICLMLKKDILCYNKSTKKFQKSRVKYSLFESSEKLRIGVCNNHFFPILIKNE